VPRRRAQQRDIAAVVEQASRRLGHVEVLQVYLHVRVRALEGGEQLGSGLVLAAGADPYRQLAGDRTGSVACGRYAAVQAGQRLLRNREERGARRGERGPLVRPVQQLGTDSVFQLPDLRAEDLLRDMDAVRGGGEARLVGDRDEVPEVAQLNVHR